MRKKLGEGQALVVMQAEARLGRLQQDADLAGVRDTEKLDGLPEARGGLIQDAVVVEDLARMPRTPGKTRRPAAFGLTRVGEKLGHLAPEPGSTFRVRSLASSSGFRSPCKMAWMMAIPVTPGTSLTTSVSLTFRIVRSRAGSLSERCYR
jgi:hypothetical protein